MTVFGMVLLTTTAAAVPSWFVHKKQYPQALFATLLFLAGVA
jgi:hypothetical protein